MDKIFLSIDIDFWAHRTDCNVFDAEDVLDSIAVKARAALIPLSCVSNHNQMLKLVNRSGANTLINYDAHTDLADIECDEFNCGTWVGYVEWANKGKYIWKNNHGSHYYYGADCSAGRCAYKKNGKILNSTWKEAWSKLIKTNNVKKDILSLTELVEVCVCMSPSFVTRELKTIFNRWRLRHNVMYNKGYINSDYRVHKVRKQPCGK